MKKLLFLFLFLASFVYAQPGNPAIRFQATDPAGACSPQPMVYNYVLGHLSGCTAGTWTVVGTSTPSAGTVTNFTGAGPSWLTWTINTPTTTPDVVLAPTTGQTPGRVIGTCGAATTFAPCVLVLGDLPTTVRRWSCAVIVGDPGAASPVLEDDNDSPAGCPNNYSVDRTITGASCFADAGTPTVTPILRGGSGTSILTGALSCGTATFAAGTINGTPVIRPFNTDGATCSVTPCSADINITTAGGVAKYIVVTLSGTF